MVNLLLVIWRCYTQQYPLCPIPTLYRISFFHIQYNPLKILHHYPPPISAPTRVSHNISAVPISSIAPYSSVTSSDNTKSSSVTNDISANSSLSMTTRSKNDISKPKMFLATRQLLPEAYMSIVPSKIPTTFAQANKNPKWKKIFIMRKML